MTDALLLDEQYVAASPLRGRPIFLLATPESGAELLQAALGALPGVTVAPTPTHLFSQGVATLFDRWAEGEETTRPQGMVELVDEQEFFNACRRLTDTVLAGVPVRNEGDRVVEYSQGHAFQTAVVAAIYPDAHLVHVVRDGRKVVSRCMSPLRSWSARDGARRWQEDQEAVANAGDLSNLHLLRFEDLIADPTGVLGALAGALQLPTTPADVDAAALILVRGARGALDPPLPHAAAIMELIGGDLLQSYGYVLDERNWAHRAARLELAVESATTKAREGVGRVAQRLIEAAQRAQSASESE